MRTSRFAPIAASALLLGLAAPLEAQDTGLGVRSGVAASGVRGVEGADARSGVAVGPTFAVPVTRWLAIQTELLYTTYGAWLNDAFARAGSPFSQVSFRYIQAPVLARLDVGKLLGGPVKALVYAGPHASAMLRCRIDIATPLSEPIPCGSAPETSPFAHMRTFDMGAVGGASLAVELFSLFQLAADVRYQHGFSQYASLDGTLRQGLWAFAIRISGAESGGAGAAYVEPPLPPAVQPHPVVPDWIRPVRGVEM